MPRPPTPGLRTAILKAAEDAFSRRGFHGVSVREIARDAGTPVSNLYSHFGSKEKLFRSLLDHHQKQYSQPDTPLAQAFANFRLPESLVEIGLASGAMVRRFATYIRLIYVDVLEFEGQHIHQLFEGMRARYESDLGPYLRDLQQQGRLAAGDPVAALMTITLSYFNYFTVEVVFGARKHFGLSDRQVIEGMAGLFGRGLLLRPEESHA